MEKDFKIKPLTKKELMISLDRLTRFKPPQEKYLRVFKDVITSNLISPKFTKKELSLKEPAFLANIAEEILNYSTKLLTGEKNSKDFSINKKLLKYEKSVFKFDENTEKLINNKIDYKSAVALFKEDNLPLNLKWLKSLIKDENQVKNRVDSGWKFPLEKIVLVEGITEEILLPKFALICGLDFDKAGIHLISAGGKNQVVKLFYKYADILKLPVFILLDNDAKKSFEQIKLKLRKKDKVHILKCGEFEDALPLNLIKKTLNRKFKNYFSITLEELRADLPMTKTLEEVLKGHGIDFKKAEFAALLKENILNSKDVSLEIQNILSELISKG